MFVPENRMTKVFAAVAAKNKQAARSSEPTADAEERRCNFASHVSRLRNEWLVKGKTKQQYANHAQTPATTINRWIEPATAPLNDRDEKVKRFCEAQGIVMESMWEPFLRLVEPAKPPPKRPENLRNEVRSKVLQFLDSDQADEEGLKLLSRLVSSLGRT